MNVASGTRVVVYALVGSSEHNGKEILSFLLNYDLFDERNRNRASHVKFHRFGAANVMAYEDTHRRVMYIHLPDEMETESTDDRSALEKEGARLIQLCATFATSHIVFLLHSGTQISVDLFRKLRIMQRLKDVWMPYVKAKLPIRHRSIVAKNLQPIRSAMNPGYCEPQLLFLFQVASSVLDGHESRDQTAQALSDQISQLFLRSDVTSNCQSQPIMNSSSMKSMLLPKFPTSMEEHLTQWIAYLNHETEESSARELQTRRFKDLIYTRRERMLQMLESTSDEVYPTVSTVQEIYHYLHDLMLNAFHSAMQSLKDSNCNVDEDCNEAVDGSGRRYGNLEDVMVAFIQGVAAVDRLSEQQCKKARQSAFQHYQQILPDIYTSQAHRTAVEDALNLYREDAHGPLVEKYAQVLSSECEEYWQQGHRQCEAKSLTGRACTKPLRGSSESNTRCLHNSGFTFVSASASGLVVRRRADPFSLVDANIEFYSECSMDEVASLSSVNPTASRSKNRQKASAHHPSKSQGDVPRSITSTDIDMRISCAADPRSAESVLVHGWCTLTNLASRDGYRHAHGLEQSGFYSGRNKLYELSLRLPVYAGIDQQRSDFDESFPPLRGRTEKPKTKESVGSVMQSYANCIESALQELKKRWPRNVREVENSPTYGRIGEHIRSSRPSDPNSSLHTKEGVQSEDISSVEDVLIGLEYESMDGTRFLATPESVTNGQHKDAFTAFIQQDIPIFLSSPKGEDVENVNRNSRPVRLFQLQRIFYLTPSPPVTFATSPSIVFRTDMAGNEAKQCNACFRVSERIVLPSSTLSVLKLPFVYSVPADLMDTSDGSIDRGDCASVGTQLWKTMVQSEQNNPYTAILEKGTILCPV